MQIKGGQVCDIFHIYHISSLHIKVERTIIVNLQENILSFFSFRMNELIFCIINCINYKFLYYKFGSR